LLRDLRRVVDFQVFSCDEDDVMASKFFMCWSRNWKSQEVFSSLGQKNNNKKDNILFKAKDWIL
jgi:hypothetical protein